MTTYHPANGAAWTKVKDGAFALGKDIYAQSGGIFEPIPHYENMFAPMPK